MPDRFDFESKEPERSESKGLIVPRPALDPVETANPFGVVRGILYGLPLAVMLWLCIGLLIYWLG